ncbi:MAG: endonuclease domain-containing protein [Deltaproteobacteria bacterium]|nr:endonuclease domain-containing protein [Deltaproteobacteria bacterium]
MLRYHRKLKTKARQLRSNTTESERLLWGRLRRKQLLGVQFYRQKPVGPYIVDFFAPKARLVIEVDGSRHMTTQGLVKDGSRDRYLDNLGLLVVRFNNLEVLRETDMVMEKIFQTVLRRIESENPPCPPLFQRGGR